MAEGRKSRPKGPTGLHRIHCGTCPTDDVPKDHKPLQGEISEMRVLHGILLSLCLAGPAAAQDMSADDVRQAARDAFGVALPDIENYPDSMVAGAWAWMSDVEDGKGALDPKTMQLIGLAVASQIPCEYCT